METKEKRNHHREERDHDRDHKERARQRHRYDIDHDHHVRRYSKHKRTVKEDDGDIHMDKEQRQSELCKIYKGRVRRRRIINDSDHSMSKVSRQEYDDDIKEISKEWGKLEELSHDDDLEEDHNSLPFLLSSEVAVERESLPTDAVCLILDKLLEPIDHVRFAAVSKQWRSVARYYNSTTQRWRKQQALPMLMIPTTKFDNQQRLYSISERKIYNNIRLQVPTVPYSDNYFCGSNHGWLASTHKSIEEIVDLENPYSHQVVVVTYRITLRNIFRGEVEAIHLPSLTHRFLKDDDCYPYLVPQVILSADPALHPNNYTVLAFCNHQVPFAFIKVSGQDHQDWVLFKSQGFLGSSRHDNAIFYKNQVYAVDHFGVFMRADVNNPSEPPQEEILIPISPHKLNYCRNSYLVESTKGDLLFVRKFSEWKQSGVNKDWLCTSSVTFMIYKVVFSEEDESTVQLAEIKSIGDDALFLFDSHSISVSASSFFGCQPNSIYYTSDDARKLFSIIPGRDGNACDMGIFNLDDKTPHHFTPLKINAIGTIICHYGFYHRLTDSSPSLIMTHPIHFFLVIFLWKNAWDPKFFYQIYIPNDVASDVVAS